MELKSISDEITRNILRLKKVNELLQLRAEDKANALGNYEMKLAQTMIELKNGRVVLLNGQEVSYTSATGLEKIAKGVCYKESIALDLAESAYRNTQIESNNLQTIINALQSKLKYMEYE